MFAKFLIVVAAGISSFAGNTLAAGVDVTVGGATIAIPAPSDLVALRKPDSLYYKYMSEMQSTAKNRLLALFLPPKEATNADSGMVPTPQDWAFAFTPGADGDQPFTAAQFRKELIPMLDTQFEKMLADKKIREKTDAASDEAMSRLFTELGADPKAAKLRLGVISPIGVYARQDSYYLYGAGTKVSVTNREGNLTEVPIVMVIGFIAVKSRVIAIAVYRRLTTREDIEAVKARALNWADAITKGN